MATATAAYDGFTVSSRIHRTSEFYVEAQHLHGGTSVKWPRHWIFVLTEYNVLQDVRLGMVE
jgi:hypothetical protein